jgi:hypothetical protein
MKKYKIQNRSQKSEDSFLSLVSLGMGRRGQRNFFGGGRQLDIVKRGGLAPPTLGKLG